MNVLVIGAGGREHALAWKILQSPMIQQIYCAPGNPGTAEIATNVDLSATDTDALIAFAKEHAVAFTVVGPEDPLANGIVDRFRAEGLAIFGPTAAAARLEASKAFAKELMARMNIPTAAYAEFSDAEAALAYVRDMGAPIVVKADGLAAGKGVTVAMTVEEAETAIREIMVEQKFGGAGARVIVEEYLEGEEASVFALTDGETVLPLISSQDHKPAYDGDQGPNTGGMGAYAPAPVVDDAMMRQVIDTVLEPCVRGMKEAGCPYTGVLYAGLMITADGPKVVEFNCRFGDPETQVLLPLLRSDVLPLLQACGDGTLEGMTVHWEDGACVTVVMASGGYPEAYEKGKPINGIDLAHGDSQVRVFHAGTRFDGETVVTNGGRVLNVTALGATIGDAIERAYKAVAKIAFEGEHHRTDIGQKALVRLKSR